MNGYNDTNGQYNTTDNYGKGYGKRPLWQWIALYVVIGGLVYAAIYYFYFSKSGGYSSNQSAAPYSQSAPSY